MTKPLIARVPDALVADVDRLVGAGVFGSRSDVVRTALVQLIDRHRRAEIGRQIVDGYRRVPQTEDDVGWPDAATVAMIKEEPW